MRKRGFAQGEQHLDCINLVHSLCTLLVRVWSDDNIKYAGILGADYREYWRSLTYVRRSVADIYRRSSISS